MRDMESTSAGLWVAKRLSRNLDSFHVWVLMVYHNLHAVFLITEQPLVLLIVELFAGITVTVWAIMETKELDACIGKEILHSNLMMDVLVQF